MRTCPLIVPERSTGGETLSYYELFLLFALLFLTPETRISVFQVFGVPPLVLRRDPLRILRELVSVVSHQTVTLFLDIRGCGVNAPRPVSLVKQPFMINLLFIFLSL